MEWIQIPILVSLPEDQDSNLDFRKGQEGQKGLLKEVDSNPYGLDANLDSNKFARKAWIRISIK